MVICRKCGAKVEDTVLWCPKCGSRVDRRPVPADEGQPVEQADVSPEEPSQVEQADVSPEEPSQVDWTDVEEAEEPVDVVEDMMGAPTAPEAPSSLADAAEDGSEDVLEVRKVSLPHLPTSLPPVKVLLPLVAALCLVLGMLAGRLFASPGNDVDQPQSSDETLAQPIDAEESAGMGAHAFVGTFTSTIVTPGTAAYDEAYIAVEEDASMTCCYHGLTFKGTLVETGTNDNGVTYRVADLTTLSGREVSGLSVDLEVPYSVFEGEMVGVFRFWYRNTITGQCKSDYVEVREDRTAVYSQSESDVFDPAYEPPADVNQTWVTEDDGRLTFTTVYRDKDGNQTSITVHEVRIELKGAENAE